MAAAPREAGEPLSPHGFQHRSGRVIALGRLVLSLVFLLGIYLDPTQPGRFESETYLLLSGYVAWSAFYLALTWNNWWREYRLAIPAHLVDMAMFGIMVFMTEGYTSPFFSFFVFIVLAATIKWGWRETAATAVVVTLLFLLSGFAATNWGEGELELLRLIFRSSYLVVLSLVLIWFAVNQRVFSSRRLVQVDLVDPDQPNEPPIRNILDFAARQFGAKRVLFAWWDVEEPWVMVAEHDASGFREQRIGPTDILTDFAAEPNPFIFDLGSGRTLRTDEDGQLMSERSAQHLEPAFAGRFGLSSGIAIPIHCQPLAGVIFLTGVPGLCADDLAIARQVKAETCEALDRTSSVALYEEAAASQTRLSLARDLHDSVIQLLVGTAFRLEGLRRSVESGREIDADIDALQTELKTSQRELRAFISEARDGRKRLRQGELRNELARILERMAQQWGVECELLRCPDRLFPEERVSHAVHQLVREAVANAVRHGGANRVTVTADAGETGLSLVIADNGGGFAVNEDEPSPKPWSLHERAQSLGGTLALFTSDRGSRIVISLPFGEPT